MKTEKNFSILCIQPWITDFAAYNLWAEPVGILTVAAALAEAGCRIRYIDCLRSEREQNPAPKEDGRSKYIRTAISKPGPLSFVPRRFARYGMSEEEFVARVKSAKDVDAVLVTSMMTYWYPGVRSAIMLVKAALGGRVPVILGGVYAKLCREHAVRTSGADLVYTGDLSSDLFRMIEEAAGKRLPRAPRIPPCGMNDTYDFPDHPAPMHELSSKNKFFALLTQRGCPFACSYCASSLINGSVARRPLAALIDEIERYTKLLGTKNLVVYDDAFLYQSERHAVPLLEEIASRVPGLSIRFPNGVHARFLTPGVARLLRRAGTKDIWIGLETCDEDLQRRTGGKTSSGDYRKAVSRLRDAGFDRREIGTYVLAGLPGQDAGDVERTLEFVHRAGGSPYLSYFSPIPGTAVWEDAVRSSPFPVAEEPLFHNKSVYVLGSVGFTAARLKALKAAALALRKEA